MNDAYRVEHMFQALDGEVWALYGLRRTKLQLNDQGKPLVIVDAGLSREKRADEIAAACLRLLLEWLTPQQLLLLLHHVAAKHPRPVSATFGER